MGLGVLTSFMAWKLLSKMKTADEPDFHALFQAAPSPYLVLTPEFTIVAANDTYLHATGTVRQDIVGQSIFDLFPHNPRNPDATGVANLRASLTQVLQTNAAHAMAPQKYDIRRHHAISSKLEEQYWRTSNTPVFDAQGRLRHILHRIEDVTAFIQSQERTTQMASDISTQAREIEHQEQFAVLFQQSPTFMAMLSGPDHRVDFVNPNYLKLIGHRDIVGQPLKRALRDADEQGYIDLLNSVYRSGEAYSANGAKYAVQSIPGASLDERYVDFVLQPIRGSNGKVRGIFVQGVDVTDRVLAEKRRDALVRLTDEFRDLDAPEDITFKAAQILGVTLNASRAGYCTFDPVAETLHVDRDWNACGVQTLAGVLNLRDFGSYIDELKLGKSNVINDVGKDHRTGNAAAALTERSASAFVNVPVMEQGQVVAILFVNDSQPRQWSSEDLAFIKEVAERTRTASERLRSEMALRESEAKFRTIADAMPQMVWSTLPDGFHDYYNQQWYDFTGVPVGATDGDGWNDMFHPEDQATAWKAWRHSLATGEPYEIQYRLRHRSGEYRWTLGRALPVRDEAGKIIRWMGTCTEIHGQKLIEDALRKQTQKLHLATDAAGIGLFDHNFLTDEFTWDAKMYAHYGVPPETKVTRETLFAQMHPEDRQRMHGEFEKIWSADGDERFQLEYRILAADGVERWIEVKGRVVFGADRCPARLIGTVMNITERKHAEKLMQQAVQHDSLTGLPNRALLYDYCSHILPMAARSHEPVAVMFIDLDRFKPINDMYGHDVGDKVLQVVAKRLLTCTRKEDIVSRLGGDEFIVVLPRIGASRDAAIVAQHMLQAIGEPIPIGTLRLSVSPSIGISLFPEHAMDLELLIRCADMAMYAAKKDGRNHFRMYSAGLIDDANDLLRLEGLLKQAVESNRLALFYQPILDAQSRELIGVEALIRIPGEDGTLLGPAEFIPVAESAGLMNRIGDWVVRQACRQHRDWRDIGLPPVTIAINVSPMQFRQPRFISVLADAIREFDVDPSYLQIEVTESAVMDDVQDTVGTLDRLQTMGIRIALDDFGTGYSSLSHLSNLPLNKLKIDKSFIHKMADSPSSRSITEAIIGLGRTLNLMVVGEGIESEDALEFLRDHGCDQVQGFLFSEPLPPAEFVSWCRSRSVH